MVKKLLAAAAVLALSAPALADTTPMGQLPPFAQPGECFARVVIPAQTDIVPREVVTQDAYERIEVSQPQFADESEQLLVKDGATRYVVRQPRWEVRTEQVVTRPGFERLRVIPAEFGTVTETIQVGEPRLVWRPGRNLSGVQRVDPSTGQVYCLVEEPGQTVTVTRRVVRTPERVVAEAVPPQTATVSRQVLVDPGGVEQVPVPPEYRTLTTQRLVTPAQQFARPVAPLTRSIDTRVVRAPERYEWVRVLCDTNASPAMISQLQQTLAARGFYRGQVDGRLGPQTSEALTAYQRAEGMPHVGFVTIDALNSLGMNTGLPGTGTVTGAGGHPTMMQQQVPHQQVYSAPPTSGAPVLEGGRFVASGAAAAAPVVDQAPVQVVQVPVAQAPVQVAQAPQPQSGVREYSVRRELSWGGRQ